MNPSNMKTKLALCTVLLALVPPAEAGTSYTTSSGAVSSPVMPGVSEPIDDRFYIDLAGGAVFLQDQGDFSFDTGWSITGAFGVNLGHGLSVEVESGYMTSDVEGFDGETEFAIGSLSGEVTVVPIMANLKYVAPVTSLFNFYVGAGLGTIYSDNSVNIGPLDFEDDGWDFAFQGIAGISIPMSEVLSFEVGYRFLGTGFDSNELRSHSVEAGINFKF